MCFLLTGRDPDLLIEPTLWELGIQLIHTPFVQTDLTFPPDLVEPDIEERSLQVSQPQSTNQFADLNINAAQPGTGAAGRTFNQPFGTVATLRAFNGFLSSNYHALQATVNRRAAEGLTLKATYTYSKAINMTDDDGWAGVGWNIPSQFPRNRVLAGFDITHNF